MTHYSFTHAGFPMIFNKTNSKELVWQVNFYDAKYNLGNDDQFDWNKLCGIKWDYFSPRENALMIGWRYNIEGNCFDLCLYVHKDGSFNPPSKPLLSVKKAASCALLLSEESNSIMLELTDLETGEQAFEKIEWYLFDSAWHVNSWFGGNRTPNRKVKFDLIYLKK